MKKININDIRRYDRTLTRMFTNCDYCGARSDCIQCGQDIEEIRNHLKESGESDERTLVYEVMGKRKMRYVCAHCYTEFNKISFLHECNNYCPNCGYQLEWNKGEKENDQ